VDIVDLKPSTYMVIGWLSTIPAYCGLVVLCHVASDL